MAGVRGDWKKLAKLLDATDRVATKALLKKNAGRMGRASLQLAKEGAAAGKNPFGRKWRKLKKTRGLALRGAAGSLRLRGRALGFEINSSQRWLVYQQAGASKRETKWRLPKRLILPKRALPKPWEERIVRAVRQDWVSNFLSRF